jgi:hypothetical protein
MNKTIKDIIESKELDPMPVPFPSWTGNGKIFQGTNLSKEYREFEESQNKSYEKAISNFGKLKDGALMLGGLSASLVSIGGASVIGSGGLLTMGMMTGATIAMGVPIAVVCVSKLMESTLRKQSFNGEHTSPKRFLKKVIKEVEEKGSEFYKAFLKENEENEPELSRYLAGVNKKYKQARVDLAVENHKKEELKEKLEKNDSNNTIKLSSRIKRTGMFR